MGNPHSATGSAQFHLISLSFAASVAVPVSCVHLIPVDVMEQVVCRYQKKESLAGIAAALGLRRGVVRRILEDRAVPLRVRSPTPETAPRAILDMHAAGKSIKEISSDLGLNFSTVYRTLRRAGRVKRKRR
jgi:DNA invertase Pin-like site-specific DNA recombinase